jgi:hypothetical protein
MWQVVGEPQQLSLSTDAFRRGNSRPISEYASGLLSAKHNRIALDCKSIEVRDNCSLVAMIGTRYPRPKAIFSGRA